MSNKHLVIFDVDGTLTQTACMDLEAYISAFVEHFGINEINNNWGWIRAHIFRALG